MGEVVEVDENAPVTWQKETVHNFLNSGKTDAETHQQLHTMNQERLKEMEYLYYKNLREKQFNDEDKKFK